MCSKVLFKECRATWTVNEYNYRSQGLAVKADVVEKDDEAVQSAISNSFQKCDGHLTSFVRRTWQKPLPVMCLGLSPSHTSPVTLLHCVQRDKRFLVLQFIYHWPTVHL